MSTPADVLTLAPREPRFAFLHRIRLGNMPLIPTLILVSIALVAIFANQLDKQEKSMWRFRSLES